MKNLKFMHKMFTKLTKWKTKLAITRNGWNENELVFLNGHGCAITNMKRVVIYWKCAIESIEDALVKWASIYPFKFGIFWKVKARIVNKKIVLKDPQ